MLSKWSMRTTNVPYMPVGPTCTNMCCNYKPWDRRVGLSYRESITRDSGKVDSRVLDYRKEKEKLGMGTETRVTRQTTHCMQSPLDTQEEGTCSTVVCKTHFRLLVSKTVRESTSVELRYKMCVKPLQYKFLTVSERPLLILRLFVLFSWRKLGTLSIL